MNERMNEQINLKPVGPGNHHGAGEEGEGNQETKSELSGNVDDSDEDEQQ